MTLLLGDRGPAVEKMVVLYLLNRSLMLYCDLLFRDLDRP
jgi:hypothetical protein